MSLYKRPNQPSYSYDFLHKGRRFTANTGTANRREAEKIEAKAKEKAKAEMVAELSNGAAMTIEGATSRYWIEVGKHHKGADTTLRDLLRLQDYFGKNTLLSAIDDNAVTRLVAWRRAHTIGGHERIRDPLNPKLTVPAPLITASTVNRSTIEPLQKVCNRARKLWKVSLPNEPNWKEHLLPEPEERVREVTLAEEAEIEAAIRPDYLPLVRFARASGLRLAECLLEKKEVDFVEGRIRTIGKWDKKINLPITSEMRAILMAEMANPTEFVFTYVAARTRKGEGGWARGERLPITTSGLKSLWRRSRCKRRGGILPENLTFHDLRHDFATKLLRKTKNLKLVQKALHHSKIETTTKYAHVLDDEVAAGMEAAAKSRQKSRKALKK